MRADEAAAGNTEHWCVCVLLHVLGGGAGVGMLGNKFAGLVGAFAVYNTSLTGAQIEAVCAVGRAV